MEPYKRELQTGVPQKITCEDCNKILASLRNVITAEELEKFKEYRYFGGKSDIDPSGCTIS